MSGLELFITSAILFFLGACVGSFLNVVMYRMDRGEDWVMGRSHCESCGKEISSFDNIPVFSYLLLQGKCRHCKAQLSIAHPVVESLIGSLFVWWFLLSSFFFKLTEQPFDILQPLFWLMVGVLLIYILMVDLRTMYIHVWAIALLTVLAWIYRLSLVWFEIMRPVDLLNALIVALLSVALLLALNIGTRGRGMGMGDVMLAAPIGLLVGWPRVLVWLFLSFFIGSLVGIFLLITGKGHMKQQVPFGPFMVIATFIALIWGDGIWQWYSGFLY